VECAQKGSIKLNFEVPCVCHFAVLHVLLENFTAASAVRPNRKILLRATAYQISKLQSFDSRELAASEFLTKTGLQGLSTGLEFESIRDCY
jgi:hypothetical protein